MACNGGQAIADAWSELRINFEDTEELNKAASAAEGAGLVAEGPPREAGRPNNQCWAMEQRRTWLQEADREYEWGQILRVLAARKTSAAEPAKWSWLIMAGCLHHQHLERSHPVSLTASTFHFYSETRKQAHKRGGFRFAIPARLATVVWLGL